MNVLAHCVIRLYLASNYNVRRDSYCYPVSRTSLELGLPFILSHDCLYLKQLRILND